MWNKRKTKILISVSVLLVLMAGAYFILRGPYVSNLLKKSLLADIEAKTGYRVVAKKMYINIFPLFVRAHEVSAFDEEGVRLFEAGSVKGYFDLSGVFKRRVTVSRVVLGAPKLWLDDERAGKLKSAVEGIRGAKGPDGAGGAGLGLRVVEVRDGEFTYHDSGSDAVFTGSGIDGEALLKNRLEFIFSADEVEAVSEGWPELKASLRGRALLRGQEVELKGVSVDFFGSKLGLSGLYSHDTGGEFSVEAEVLPESFKRSFGLKRSGEGKIHAEGTVTVAGGFKDPGLDLNINGELYVETLMELLGLNVRVEGWTEVTGGTLKGKIANLDGKGVARMRNGNLFGLDIDELSTDVTYGPRSLSFKNGRVDLYGGVAEAEVELQMPRVKRYSVSVDASDIDSPPLLKLLNLGIGLPKGKVTGTLRTSGVAFNPDVRFRYKSTEGNDDDVLGRVKEVEGVYHMRDGVLSVSESEARTERSSLRWTGTIDLNRRELALNAHLETGDIRDISAPYFKGLGGAGSLQATVTGPVGDPLVEGTARLYGLAVDNIPLGDIGGRVSYKKNLLRVEDLSGESITLGGAVGFPDAKNLFDLRGPVFDLSASLKDADVKGLTAFLLKKDLPVHGTAEVNLFIKGTGARPVWSGEASVTGAEAYGFRASKARGGFSFDYGELVLKDVELMSGKSLVRLDGRYSMGGEFTFKASSDRVAVLDVYTRPLPFDATMKIEATASGTFDEPVLSVEAELIRSRFKERSAGSGTVSASLKGRELEVKAELFGRRLALTGGATLRGEMPWRAKLGISGGRYDFIMSAFMKKIPSDMLLSLKGGAELSGNAKELRGSARITQANVTMFGQSFSNDSDIVFDYDGRRLTVTQLSLKSGNTEFNLAGDLAVGGTVDLTVHGTSALSPLKGFFDNVEVIRGSTEYVFSIRGEWDKPVINGGITVTGGSLAVKDVPHRLSSIDSYIYVQDNRIVIEELEGKLGGGDVGMAGMVEMDGLRVRRFYLDLLLSDVTASLRRGFVANVGGNIVLRGEPGDGEIVGELTINRAKYTDMIEWKSWLIKAKKRDTLRAGAGRFADIKLNVAIHGSDNIIIDNNIANATLSVDLAVGGTIGDPLLLGRVVSRQGKVYFRNNEFDILAATADFADPGNVNPVVEVQAETVVKGYNIRLGLDGQLDRFNLKLSSDPPLEDVEILGLLTVGDFGENLKGLEGGIGAAEATAFLTGEFQDVLEKRLRDITGIDRFQINPYVSKTTGTITPRITLSKRLLGEKLFVTVSTAVSTEEEQVVKLEYMLKKNVSLVGIRDERGSMGGDVTFRFEFR